MASRDQKGWIPGGYNQPLSTYDRSSSSRGHTAPTQMSEDEALAYKLQEQFDLESEESSGNYTAGQPTSYASNNEKSATAFSPPAYPEQSLSNAEQAYHQSFDPTAATAPLYPTDYASDLPSLRTFAKQVAQVGCSKCGNSLLHSKITPQDITKSWFEKKSIHSNSAVRCSKCAIYTCVGCGNAPQSKAISRTTSGDGSLGWCCDQGRLFIIWVLLCLFDQQYLNATANSRGKASSILKATRLSHSSASKTGTGFGGSQRGVESGRHAGIASFRSNTKASSDATDAITQRVTNFLETIWPGSLQSETGSFDAQPPPVLLTMVSNSFLLDNTATLLRNDSIEDVSKRADVYDKVLSWISAVASHPLTANLVINDRPPRGDKLSLLQISFHEPGHIAKGKSKDESSPSIAKCLQNLSTQSRMMVENFERSKAQQSEKTQNTLNICKGILLVMETLNRYMPIEVVVARDPANAWKQWQRDKAVSDVSDQELLYSHVLANHGRAITHSPKDRIPRLIRELTNLKTSLPPGIFVRHAINRVDLWKVLIIGSPHTPYAHGLFEFDVCFPGNYPRQPPIFYFIAGGRYRIGMNPNLHPDGKVCLSLLNTWPGPSWNPAHSTPLQILVSIQAMIFCEEPWFNEPGREDPQIAKNPRALPASQVYNAHVRAGTVQYCVLPWFRDQGIWGEVVAEHFKTN
ncbi:MAG: hypothetical protein Q9157_008390, partial [Trypethelium eluteriae]